MSPSRSSWRSRLAASTRDRVREAKKIEPAAYIDQHLLSAVPVDTQHVDVTLGDGELVYVGNIVDKPAIAPGSPIQDHAHLAGEEGDRAEAGACSRCCAAPSSSADFANLPITDMEIGHGPVTWRAGEIIADVQEVVLRPDWRSASATLQVGLIRVGEHGTGDRMAAVGPHTQDRAVIAKTLVVDLTKAPPPPSTIYISRAQGVITVDGAGNDPGWAAAVQSPEFQTAEGSPEPVGKATAKMTWDDDNLYVFVTVTDSDIVSPYKNHDDSLWKADDVEVFIDADHNGKGYVELQVNPHNATFDSWFADDARSRATRPGTAACRPA